MQRTFFVKSGFTTFGFMNFGLKATGLSAAALQISAIALFATMTAYGQTQPQPQAQSQPLGDIARQYREKQQAQEAAATPPRTFTNKDLPANPEGYRPRDEQPQQRSDINQPADDRAVQQRLSQLGQQREAEIWRGRIVEQEGRVANLQARIDQANAAVHPPGSAQYDGPYNRFQARQQERIAQMQMLLDEQRRRLNEMQEAARRAGMHTATYDP